MTGKFITIEGIDGAGKTSVTQAVDRADLDVDTVKSPTDHWTGQRVREAISNEAVTDLSTLYLFMADMSYNADEIIAPALEAGRTVVCDRYFDSTLAYQLSAVEGRVAYPWYHLQDIAASWYIAPDVTIYLKISVDTAMDRIGKASDDRFERRDVLEAVKSRYDTLSSSPTSMARYVVVDGEQDLDTVIETVTSIIREHHD